MTAPVTPECTSAWRNYERPNDTKADIEVYSAFVAGWHAATEAAVNATLERSIPSVGHVCVGPPSSRKPGLCWICGQALPHDCVGGAHPQPCWQEAWNGGPHGKKLTEVGTIVQTWLDKQGHERCWYYPELFSQLAAALGLQATVASALPLQAEFVEGCKRYQAEQYGKALTPVTHGPPQKVDTIAAKLIEQKKELAAALFSEPAKRLAPPIAPTGRKWPICTPDETAYYYGTADEWHLRLRAARIHCGLTLDALARRLNPPRTRKDISAMEHGRRGLSVELCAQLADALDCDRCWLAGWTLPGGEP